MFPLQQFPGQGLSSPGVLRMRPGQLGNDPVNRPTSSSSTLPPGPFSSAPCRPPISLPTKRFLPPAESQKADVGRNADLLPLPEISYNDYDADDESYDPLDLGGAEGTPAVSPKQIKFSLMEFA